MKKIFIVLLGLMLVGCQSPQSQPTTNQTKKEKGDLILKEWKYSGMEIHPKKVTTF